MCFRGDSMNSSTRLDHRPQLQNRWYHDLICSIAKPLVKIYCKHRAERSFQSLESRIGAFLQLRTRDAVIKSYGAPAYTLTGTSTGWTNEKKERCHPDWVDVYQIDHCTIDLRYIGQELHSAFGCVSIDPWDSNSGEVFERNQPGVLMTIFAI